MSIQLDNGNRVVLEKLGEKSMTDTEIAEVLGWNGGRVRAIIRCLSGKRFVHQSRASKKWDITEKGRSQLDC